jgi:MFS family permease
MGALSLLFASFRGKPSQLVSRAGAASVVALAIGPALGGALTRLGPAAPFRFAAAVSLMLAAWAAWRAVTTRKAAVPNPRAERRAAALTRLLWAPLLLVASQRFVIGGLVAVLAIHLREQYGFSDARVGMCFSVLLVMFAAGVCWSGKRVERESVRLVVAGCLAFAAGIGSLSVLPSQLIVPALALAGVGAAFVYAPCLAQVAAQARPRATAMALLHAAGGVGMVLGPLAALALASLLSAASASTRSGAFLVTAALAHAVCALLVLPSLRRLETLQQAGE